MFPSFVKDYFNNLILFDGEKKSIVKVSQLVIMSNYG